jgi:hypothetical protein
MIKLSEFKSNLIQFVRPNRFFVEITPPKALSGQYDPTTLIFLAQSAKIPDRTAGEVEVKYHGMSLKLPGDYSHEDLSINFLNYYDWTPRDFLEDWMNLIQNIDGNNERTDSSELLVAQIKVKQLGLREDVILAAYDFFNVFPKTLQSIELNMETTDSVETFTADFSYSHWLQDYDSPSEDIESRQNRTKSNSGAQGPPDLNPGPPDLGGLTPEEYNA